MILKLISYQPKRVKSISKTVYNREVVYSEEIKESYINPSKTLGLYQYLFCPSSFYSLSSSDLKSKINEILYSDNVSVSPLGDDYVEFQSFIKRLLNALKLSDNLRVEIF